MNARQRRKAKRTAARNQKHADSIVTNPRVWAMALDRMKREIAAACGVDYGGWVTPAPRYDEVFFEGVAWLNTL